MTQPLLHHKADNGVATLELNRPNQQNAINEALVDEMLQILQHWNKDPDVRVLLIRAKGDYFSCGMDINWLKELASSDLQDIEAAAVKGGQILRSIFEFSKPTVCRVQGPAYEFAAGLAACCDIVLCTPKAHFCFPSVRLGMVPSAVAPYLVETIGPRQTLRYFLTGARIRASEAVRIGLAHVCYRDDHSLDKALTKTLEELMMGGPEAQSICKRLVTNIDGLGLQLDRLDPYTSGTLAHMFANAESREGLDAYFQRRSPPWHHGPDEPPR